MVNFIRNNYTIFIIRIKEIVEFFDKEEKFDILGFDPTSGRLLDRLGCSNPGRNQTRLTFSTQNKNNLLYNKFLLFCAI